MTKQAQLNKVINYLADLETNNFFGSLTLKFENGHIVHLRREENLKLHGSD